MPTHSVTLSVHKLLTLSINIRNTENSVLFSLFSMSASGLLLFIYLWFLVIIFFHLAKNKDFWQHVFSPLCYWDKMKLTMALMTYQHAHLLDQRSSIPSMSWMMNSVKGKLTTDDDIGNSCSVPIFSKFSNRGFLPLRGGLGHSVLLTPTMRKCNKFPTVGPQKRSFSKTQLLSTELLIDGGHITVAQVYPESYYVQWLGHYF